MWQGLLRREPRYLLGRECTEVGPSASEADTLSRLCSLLGSERIFMRFQEVLLPAWGKIREASTPKSAKQSSPLRAGGRPGKQGDPSQ